VTTTKHDASHRFWDLLEQFKGQVDVRTDDPNWTNPYEIVRLALSHSVFPGSPLDDAIAIAFVRSGLNVRDPLHWKLLLGLFCLAHFAEWPKPAAHKLWTSARLQELDEHIAAIESRHPDFSDVAVARTLKEGKPYSKTYGQYSINYIRELIRDAKSSKREFEELLHKHLRSTRPYYESAGIEWTCELEAKLTQSFLDTARQVSGLTWKPS
jgi:hypothetical protein